MSWLRSKIVLPRPAAAALAVAGLALAGLAAEALLVAGGIALARQDPGPYLLTHLLAVGTLSIALLTLVLAGRVIRWAGSSPESQVSISSSQLRRLPGLRPGIGVWELLIGLGATGLVAYGFYFEPRRLESPEIEVRVAGLPASFDGLRIVLISDIHVGPHFGPEDVERVVATSNRLRPDIVALAGDYVARDPADAAAAAAGISRLEAPLGVFAVLGNHDYWKDDEAIASMLSGAGARLLRNSGLRLERGDGGVWLAGVEDIRWGRPDIRAALAGATEAEPTILLVHNPMFVRQAELLGIPLVLSGHTHGGQVTLPLIGPLIVPVRDRGLTQGLVQVGRSQIYVTRGVGVGTPPARLGARPEVPLLVLRPA